MENENQVWVIFGQDMEPQKPENLGLPPVEVRSRGSVIYKPRFTTENGQLMIHFGHWFGGGVYVYKTIRDGQRGLLLYLYQKNENDEIDQIEMNALRYWMKLHEDQLADRLVEMINKPDDSTNRRWFKHGFIDYSENGEIIGGKHDLLGKIFIAQHKTIDGKNTYDRWHFEAENEYYEYLSNCGVDYQNVIGYFTRDSVY